MATSVTTPNVSGQNTQENPYEDIIQKYSKQYGVDPWLIKSMMHQESGGQPGSVSNKGAIGLMQLMPDTAKGLGVDPNDPIQNLEGGIRHFAGLFKNYGGNIPKSLAAYNAGEGNVAKYGGIPPFAETQDYVKKISDAYAPHQSKTIRIEGVGRFQVPSTYTDDQISQHIYNLKKSNPEIFTKQYNTDPYFNQDTTQGPGTISNRPNTAGNWLEDLKNDITEGGGRTFLGRAAETLGYHGLPHGGDALAGRLAGGPVLGPVEAAHGVSQLGDHPVRGANEILRGAGDTLALPMGVASPGMLGEMLPYLAAAKAGKEATSLFTDDSDYQELGGNAAALGIKPAASGLQSLAGKALDHPMVDKIVNYGAPTVAGYRAVHGDLSGAAKALALGAGVKTGLRTLAGTATRPGIGDFPILGQSGLDLLNSGVSDETTSLGHDIQQQGLGQTTPSQPPPNLDQRGQGVREAFKPSITKRAAPTARPRATKATVEPTAEGTAQPVINPDYVRSVEESSNTPENRLSSIPEPIRNSIDKRIYDQVRLGEKKQEAVDFLNESKAEAAPPPPKVKGKGSAKLGTKASNSTELSDPEKDQMIDHYLGNMSDSQLRNIGYKQGIDVLPGETKETLMPKLKASLKGQPAPASKDTLGVAPTEDLSDILGQSLTQVQARKASNAKR